MKILTLEEKLKKVSEDCKLELTLPGFKSHWESKILSPNWVYVENIVRILIINLLVLNNEVEKLRAEVQELQGKVKPPEGITGDPLLQLLKKIAGLNLGYCTAKELFGILQEQAAVYNIPFTLDSPRALGNKLQGNWEELQKKFTCQTETGAGNVKRYKFSLL